MKQTMLRLCLAIAVAGFAAACGGGGDDDGNGGLTKPYNFAGRWAWSGIVTASNVPTIPVGQRIADIMTITQDGTTVSVSFIPTAGTTISMTGTCDPVAGTFAASGVTAGSMPGIRMSVSGAGVDDDSMSGGFEMALGGFIASGTWTADLVSRTVTFSGADGAGGLLRAAGRLRQLQ